ncbi:MAG: dihydrolipoyl dehydrogenase [Alphaproteobacteria bacterium]|nr:dihydrolipoyl dehydrogenase [Alphaproteobacteria bacterium]MBM3952833.1 dihydrolipoyl dehydrogenase [Rhodospirillales bacterium]
MSESFDLVVVGGGPGGYVAAIRAAQLGLKAACVEKRGALGGTCLNVGCIPSKALLQSSHHYEMAAKEFAHHGVKVGKLDLDLGQMMARKEKVVKELTSGVEFLFKKNKVHYVKGTARLVAADTLSIAPAQGGPEQTLKASSVVIATGSDVAPLKGVPIDEKKILSSTGAIALAQVPESLAVIGGGVIGLELGSVWRRLGAKVTVIEFLDSILPGMDGEVAKFAQRVLAKQGMTFRLATKVTGAKSGKKVRLSVEPRDGGKSETVEADAVLVAVGRRPYTEGLGLEAVGVALDARGFVTVDRHFQTNVPGVFAIGDVIGGAMLAHKAEDEGVAVAEIIAGEAGHVNHDAIPAIVYTAPEIAGIGKTEEQLKSAGRPYRAGKFPFTANARAKCNAETDGFAKVLADAATDRVVGAHIVGPQAGELIQEIALAIEMGASAEDLGRTCHGHPGLVEAVKEAALASLGRAIHI